MKDCSDYQPEQIIADKMVIWYFKRIIVSQDNIV